MITDAEINLLHSTFCKLTGQDLRMNRLFDTRRLAWQHFAVAGHTREELEFVLLHLKRGIHDGYRNPGCLRFSNLVENVPGFEEELELARGQKRNAAHTVSTKDSFIYQRVPVTGPPVEVCTARHVGEIMARGFEAMRAAANAKEA